MNVNSIISLDLSRFVRQLYSLICSFRPEVVAQCIVDLIEDESEKGAVVKVTQEDGVEYLNFNDVSICTIANGLNRFRRNTDSLAAFSPKTARIACS